MPKTFGRGAVRAALAAAALALSAATAAAADFYAGKTVTLNVGFGPGGTYDLYSRIAGRHLGKHLPGAPSIVVRNVIGGGSINLSNYMYRAAPKDGTWLGVVTDSVALDQLLETQGVEYDAGRFNWIGRMTTSTSAFFAWHTSPTKSFADILKRETIMGSSGSGTTMDSIKALNSLANAKIKVITGYRGSTEVMLAMERGEVEMAYALWDDFKVRKADWLADKKVSVLFVLGPKVADLPDVPGTAEVAPNEESRRIFNLFASASGIGRALFTTPDVPAAQLAQLRAAFIAMVADPEFLAEARQVGMQVDPLDGARLQRAIAETIATPRDLVERAKQARK
jgi:tripartite-type tricarboxylate transporter receptor subunit TctC